MKYAVQQSPDGTSRMVDATGKPLGNKDADYPLLHVLPKLFVPAGLLGSGRKSGNDLRCKDITLELNSTPISLLPEGGVVIRQPYPNRRYFAGGSKQSRNGWLVPIPLGETEFTVEFLWNIKSAAMIGICGEEFWRVLHIVHIKLHPGKGVVYSMDSSNWPDHSVGAMYTTPCAELGLGEDSLEYKERQIIKTCNLMYSGEAMKGVVAGNYLEERIDVTGVPLEQAWSLKAFEEEQIHEVQQKSAFTKDNEAHRANGPVEMPAELLYQAIDLAARLPFDEGSEFARKVKGVPGGCELHPAMKLLCNWWETVRPKGEPYKPGIAMVLVRVRDDGEYWWGDHEVPNSKVNDFNEDGRDAARIGDSILVLFQATQESAVFDEMGMDTFLPSGAPFTSIGCDKEEYLSGNWDEAYTALAALAGFPRRFPAAWKFLKSSQKPKATAKKRRKQ